VPTKLKIVKGRRDEREDSDDEDFDFKPKRKSPR
jgi:hypothetical protein